MIQKYAVIVAGGSGSRMGSSTPKQFMLLKQKPVLMHTIEAFFNADQRIEIILVLPENHINYWNDLCKEYDFNIHHRIVIGGKERFFSVKNAIDTIAHNDGLIAIHDGARPLISPGLINQLFDELNSFPCVIPVVTPKESIRELDNNLSKSVDRNRYVLVQTPQCFKADIIKSAYEVDYQSSFTDDASVVEYSGHQIHLIEGDYSNIKITNPEDIQVCEILIKK